MDPLAVDQPGVRVAGDQHDAAQAAGDEVGEEHVPRLLRLAGGDLDAEDLAAPVGVHAGRDEHDVDAQVAAFRTRNVGTSLPTPRADLEQRGNHVAAHQGRLSLLRGSAGRLRRGNA